MPKYVNVSVRTADLMSVIIACRGVMGKDISGGLTPEGDPVAYVGVTSKVGRPRPAVTELVNIMGVEAAADVLFRKGASVNKRTLRTAFEE